MQVKFYFKIIGFSIKNVFIDVALNMDKELDRMAQKHKYIWCPKGIIIWKCYIKDQCFVI